MLYGLLIAGGLLAYFTWKKNIAGASNNSKKVLNSTSGTFIDDVPVSKEIADKLLQNTGGIKPVKSMTERVSEFVQPLIKGKQQEKLSGQGQFLES